MSQSTINKTAAAIQQYELDRPGFLVDRIVTDYDYGMREQRLLRKLDIRLLPVFALFYFMAFLDRGTMTSAETEGMPQKLHITQADYNNCWMIFFVTYCAFQVPSNIMSKKTTPSFWLPTLMCCWGVVLTCMGLVVDYKGLFWSRFFLGVFEAGLFPGICIYLSMWYKRTELQYRLATVWATGTAAGSFGGLLGWCIVKMDKLGGMEGWRWIFVLEGCTSVVVGSFAYMFLCNTPASATFLTEEEQEMVVVRVKTDEGWCMGPAQDVDIILEQVEREAKQSTWVEVKQAFSDWQPYLHALIYISIHAVIYEITLALPLLIGDMGFTGATAYVLTVPIFITACIGSVLIGIVSDKIGSRSSILIFCYFMMTAGYILVLLYKVRDTRHSVAYAGMFVAALGSFSAIPTAIAWLANNSMGAGKRSISLALQIGIGNLGGIVVSYSYDSKLLGAEIILGMLAVGFVLILVTVATYRRINQRRKLAILKMQYRYTWPANMTFFEDRSLYFEYVY